jgi:integrase
MFAATNGKALKLNNVLSRQILPALRRCERCDRAEGEHAKADHAFKLDEGAPEKVIQQILRHANVNTSNTYYIKTLLRTPSCNGEAPRGRPQLGNEWATELTSSKESVAVN